MYTTATEKYSFETGIYRPPSEGGSYSLLLRVTRNCPWNKCTFCAMYKGEKFAARPAEEVIHDIDSIASLFNAFLQQIVFGILCVCEVQIATCERDNL